VPRFAFHAWAGQAGWQEQGWFAILDRERTLALFRPGEDPELKRNLAGAAAERGEAAQVLEHARAYWQTVNNLLLDNRVAPP
jgi:hypothetical protein